MICRIIGTSSNAYPLLQQKTGVKNFNKWHIRNIKVNWILIRQLLKSGISKLGWKRTIKTFKTSHSYFFIYEGATDPERL